MADAATTASWLKSHIKGSEFILFKGSQYLEWVVEQLLQNKSDSQYLPRRETAAIKRRNKRGLKS